MSCKCGHLFSLCENQCLCSESTCGCGDSGVVVRITCEICNKPFHQEKTTVVEKSREWSTCPTKISESNEMNEECQSTIQSTAVDSAERKYVQRNAANQEVQTKTEGLDVVETTEVPKTKSHIAQQITECDGTNQVIERMMYGAKVVNYSVAEDRNKYLKLVDERANKETVIANAEIDATETAEENKCGTLINESKNNQLIQMVGNGEVVNDDLVAEPESKCWTPIDKNRTNRVIQTKTGVSKAINDIVKYVTKRKCGTSVFGSIGTPQKIQNRADDSKASYSVQEADEEEKTVSQEIGLAISELKRIKDKIKKLHRAIDEFNEDKQNVTEKVSFLLSSKENGATVSNIFFDKLQKYSNRIRSTLDNIPEITNKIEKLANEVEKVTYQLIGMRSKIPEIAVQFQKMSVENKSLSIEYELNQKTSSDTDELRLINKMLKISDKMQKNLIYSNDLLLKSKWELMKLDRGLPKNVSDLYSVSNC